MPKPPSGDPGYLPGSLASIGGCMAWLDYKVSGTGGFANDFNALLIPLTQSNGVLDTRIQGETDDQNDLTQQISDMEDRLTIRENMLKAQFTAMESAMSQNQSLMSQLAASLPSTGR